jgi:hypothetical protein
MFPLWLRRFVLAAALVVTPLHGIAATLTVLLCHGDAQVHASHAASGHAEGEHAGSHSHGSTDSDEGGSNSIFHLCCNLTASAPPAAIIASYLPDFPVRVFQPDQLHDSFVPELPQRPPLA